MDTGLEGFDRQFFRPGARYQNQGGWGFYLEYFQKELQSRHAGETEIRHHEVEVSSYPLFRYPPYDLALASRLAELAEESHLDLVHVHYAIPHAVAALLVKDIIRPHTLPVVTTLHGTDITIVGQDPAYERVTKYALQGSDAVTSVSE